jgi:hypothetical protein
VWRIVGSTATIALVAILGAGVARAESNEEPPGPPAGPPPSSAVATEAKPPTASEAMPADRPEVLPPIEVGAWVRLGGIFQNQQEQSKLNDWHLDTAYVELHTGGRLTKHIGVTLNFDATVTNLDAQPGSNAQTYVGIEDAILQLDFIPEFHFWGGHLLVPVDRTNAAGPWFNVMWNFPPGAFVGALPRTGPGPWNVGRNNGGVVWGDVAGGHFSYAAGAFDNGTDMAANGSVFFSGHLRLALLDPETGYWGNESYFGEKNILSLDLGGQFQKSGNAPGPGNYSEINAGALFEKKLSNGSWLTAEGAYYHYGVPGGLPGDSFYVVAAFATPRMGYGNIQPAVRYQEAQYKGGALPNAWNLDVALGYLIKGPALRFIATYSRTESTAVLPSNGTNNGTANSIQIGGQGIFF